MDVEVKVTGMQELEARLLELDALVSTRMMNRVLRKAAKPMFEAAQTNAANISGTDSNSLAASIVIARRRAKGNQVARTVVTSKTKHKVALYVHNAFYHRQRKGIFYGWLVDQGHRVATKRTGWLRKNAHGRGAGHSGTGKVDGKPWWTPAVTANEGKAGPIFISELRKALDRLARRKSKTASPDSLVSE